jgi:hypothetical protein
MRPTLIPTLGETVRCIRDSLVDVIAPQLTTQTLRSSIGSAIQLLHYVEWRIEDEGQMLYDEIKCLRGLFDEILAFQDERPEGASLAKAIRQTLDAKRDGDVYPSLKLLAEEIGRMRQHVCDSLVSIQSTSDPQSEKLRESLYRYTAWQILREEKLISSAFRGRGPRR